MNEDEYLEEDEGPRQPPLYLITGLVIGLAIGLLISLVFSPIQYVDTDPSLLAANYKDDYRLLIAQAYQANGDLGRARQRLALLEELNQPDLLAAQAQQLLAEGEAEEPARALAGLASALAAPVSGPVQSPPPAAETALPGAPANTTAPFATLDLEQAVQTATLPPTQTLPPTATSTPQPTFTPRSGTTPLPTLGAPFELVAQEDVCEPDRLPGLLQIEVQDNRGRPIAGVQINVAWDGGLDTFYTGLRPSISPGYADFNMTAGVVYSLRAGELSETINGLQAPQCGQGGSSYTGGLRLVLQQP